MKHLNKKLIYIMMAFVVAMACVCVAFIKVNATAADVKSEQNAGVVNDKQLNADLVIDKNDESLGRIIDESTREPISTPYTLSISDSCKPMVSGSYLYIIDEEYPIYTFVAEENKGESFNGWSINGLQATANFERKEEPVETLHIWGQVSNTSQESVSNATITLTTTKPEANTYTVKTNGTGSFTMEDLPQGVTGSFTINYDSGYVLEKSIDNLQASEDDFKIEAYHIYKLNLAVSDEELGHIQISGQEADAKHDIYESQSQVKTNGEDLVVTYKGVDTTYKAVAKDGATFKNWEVEAADTNLSLGDTVTGNLTATANFEKKVDPTPDPDPKPTPTPDPTPTPTPDPTPASDDNPASYDNGGSTSSSTGDSLPIPFIALGALGALGCAVVIKKKFI